ncbi:MAG: hypothetical protein IPK16_33590 [Anaerolineales bacterium]|nr:hypothetical protein [Anaerolineales bacterium]
MTRRRWFALGIAGGLIGLVRQPDATFLVLPVLDALFSRRFRAPWARCLLDMLVYGGGFLALFWIQLAAWWVMYGSPFAGGYLYGGQEGFNWADPQMIPVLFSLWHGLFVWHPVYLLGVVGLVPLARRDWSLALACAIGFVLQVYVISAWWVWTQGDSFGGRMFIATLPLLALGLASFFDWLAAKGWQNAGWALAFLLVVWNGLFLIQYRMRYISFAGPITFEELTIGKWWMLQDLWQKLLGRLR